MNFFSQKNKNNKNDDNLKIQAELEKEIIVHNMPSQIKISGEILNPQSAGNVSLSQAGEKSSKSFKMMGVLIVIFGVIFIALIVFLTYKFVISPTAKETESNSQDQGLEKPVVQDEVKEKEVNSVESEVSLENQEVVVVEDEKELNDGSQSEEFMQEEFTGINPINLPLLIDSDEDGLFDEEEAILGTAMQQKDSDDDGYEDLQEIIKGYNPIGKGFLNEASSVSSFIDIKNNLSFIYPSVWELKKVNNNLITFEINDGSLIQLVIMEGYNNLSILNWYQENFTEEEMTQDKLISKDDYEGVISKNGLNIYITNKAKDAIYVFSYIPASPERLGLINIFNLIYSSLKFEL